jgi:hypothetical protein
MRNFLLASALLSIATAAGAQSVQSGSIGGMSHDMLPASGGCSAATPCSVATATPSSVLSALGSSTTTDQQQVAPAIESATITPGGGSITGADGHVWTITAFGSIVEDGHDTPGGGGTSALTIVNGTVYGQDNGHDGNTVNSGGWFTLSSDGPTWRKSSPPGAEASTAGIPAGLTQQAQPIALPAPICGSRVATGAFKVANGQVISPDGKPFIARGINVYDSLINEGSAMIAMFPGLNFVRVGIHAYNDPASYQAFVTQMTSKGIVVAFEDHPDGGGGQDPAYTGSKLAAESNWYASMASAFKNNPYVWFGTFNEPGTQGGSVSAWEKATYDAIRGTGNNSPILLEITGWPGAWNNAMNPADYAGMTNTMWDAHYYGWVPRYSTDQATVDQALADLVAGVQAIKSADGTMPVIIAEYGNSTDGTTIDPNGVQVVTSVANAGASGRVVGSAAWAWKPGGNADHLQDGGALTSPYGQQVAMYIGKTVQTCTAAQTAANAQEATAAIEQAMTQDPTTPAIAAPTAANAMQAAQDSDLAQQAQAVAARQ